jgi:hypothetical protein
MGRLTVLYWRDIPAQVVAREGRRTAKCELPARFQEAIDAAAMRAGTRESDAYLAEWRRGEPVPCGDDLEAEAQAAASRLEAAFDRDRLARLVEAGGRA